MGKQIQLLYGRTGLKVELPEAAVPTFIQKKPLPVPDDAGEVIMAALRSPIGSGTLESAAKGAKSACILVCDVTRPVPNGLFLRPIIERLMSSGLDKSAITILIATGLHRFNVGEELAEVIGDPWVMENIHIVNHDARDDDAHVMLGKTETRGTPVGIDRRFHEAELKIVTGLVEPHFMAGYSGGRKVIAPGVAHHSTIRTFHSARFMEHPKATSCNLEGNPLHEEQLEILKMLGDAVYAFNTVIDEERNLVYASFGDVLKSHQAAVDFVGSSTHVRVPRRFNTLVTTAAGHPLDKTYYQTIKGMITPLSILEPGGDLIIAAACSEGIGSVDFRKSQARLREMGPGNFLDSLMGKDQADIDEWQSEMELKSLRLGQVGLYSDLSEADFSLTGAERITDLTEAIRRSIEKHDDNAIAVIPEGPYVVPFYAPEAPGSPTLRS